MSSYPHPLLIQHLHPLRYIQLIWWIILKCKMFLLLLLLKCANEIVLEKLTNSLQCFYTENSALDWTGLYCTALNAQGKPCDGRTITHPRGSSNASSLSLIATGIINTSPIQLMAHSFTILITWDFLRFPTEVYKFSLCLFWSPFSFLRSTLSWKFTGLLSLFFCLGATWHNFEYLNNS